jgi:3-(3-hydroxy-phenyl)propionate hydroxylase
VPGAPMDDAPVARDGQAGWLLDQLGNRFQCLVFLGEDGRLTDADAVALQALAQGPVPIEPLLVARQPVRVDGFAVIADSQGLVARRYDARPGTCYLARPDQHVAARWRTLDAARVRAALARATCNA